MAATRFSLVATLVLAGSCSDWAPSDRDGNTELDLKLLSTMVLRSSAASDPGNEYVAQPAARWLGQQLFFDAALAIRATDGEGIACTDCHSPKKWFSDARDRNNVSVGMGTTKRNSPSLVNVGFYSALGWDGRADSVWGQSHVAYSAGAVMAGTKDKLVATVRQRYSREFATAFGTEVDALSVDAAYTNALKALGAYLTNLTSTDSPFDRYATGEEPEALTPSQKNGLRLFLGKAGCIACHSGSNFSDHLFHSVGIGQTGAGVPEEDRGREEGLRVLSALAYRPAGATTPAPSPDDLGKFRTKSLRQVAQTGPYFHAGQLQTLKDVVWFYTQGGDHAGLGKADSFLVPLGLSDPEQADLVSFLESLTGQPVATEYTCDNSATVRRVVETLQPELDGGLSLADGGAPQVSALGALCTSDAGAVLHYEPFKRDFEVCASHPLDLHLPAAPWVCP